MKKDVILGIFLCLLVAGGLFVNSLIVDSEERILIGNEEQIELKNPMNILQDKVFLNHTIKSKLEYKELKIDG